jgi:alkylhydroperoxidase family enzyme
VKEAVILSVAYALAAEYEIGHHEMRARRVGFDESQLQALRAGIDPTGSLPEVMAVAARMAREVVLPGDDGAKLVEDSRRTLGDRATVDLVVTASYYGMLAAIERLFNITLDDDH